MVKNVPQRPAAGHCGGRRARNCSESSPDCPRNVPSRDVAGTFGSDIGPNLRPNSPQRPTTGHCGDIRVEIGPTLRPNVPATSRGGTLRGHSVHHLIEFLPNVPWRGTLRGTLRAHSEPIVLNSGAIVLNSGPIVLISKPIVLISRPSS